MLKTPPGLLLIFLITGVLSATDVSGPVSGSWSPAGNPYNVVGNAYVSTGSSLTIQPGVEVYFQGAYEFKIQSSATLIAQGNSEDSILFTAQNPSIPWLYIYFLTANSNSVMSYCKIEYGGSVDATSGYGAVTIEGCNVTIQNCEFAYNHSRWGGAVYCRQGGSPLIENCNLHDNQADYNGGGIGFSYNINASVNNCDIHHNTAQKWGGGVYIYNNSTVHFHNTRIYENASYNSTNDNGGGGLFSSANSTVTVDSSWIYNNHSYNGYGGGICFRQTTFTLTRSVICGNTADDDGGGTAAVRPAGDTTTIYLLNCDVYGNSASGSGGGIKDSTDFPNQTVARNTVVWGNTAPSGSQCAGQFRLYYCDVGQTVSGVGNINANPLFIYPDTMNFYLQSGSPCIDAGDPDPSYNDPDGTINDIGVNYFPQNLSIYIFPDTLIFDTTQVGGTDTSQFFVVNELNLSVWVDSVICTSPYFSALDSAFSIPARDTVAIPAHFSPPGSGTFFGLATAYSQGLNDSVVLCGPGVGSFYVNPASLYFGNCLLGYPYIMDFWTINPTQIPIIVDSITWGSPVFDVSPISFTIPPLDSVAVTVTFTPVQNGQTADTVVVFSGSNFSSVAVSGSGYGFLVVPSSLNFGSVGVGASDTLFAHAVNQGLISLTINQITFSNNVFRAVGTNFNLPPTDTVDIGIIFTPAVSGNASGQAIFYGSAGLDTVQLSGFGVGWSIWPDTVFFPGPIFAGQYDTLNLYFANYETQDFIVDSMHWSDPAYIINNTSFSVPTMDTVAVQIILHTYVSGYHGCTLYIYTNHGLETVLLLAWVTFVGVEERPVTPWSWEFAPPHPNPFNSQLNLDFSLSRPEEITLTIWDIQGHRIACLEDGRLEPGTYHYQWCAENIPSGLYFVRLNTATASYVKKVILLR